MQEKFDRSRVRLGVAEAEEAGFVSCARSFACWLIVFSLIVSLARFGDSRNRVRTFDTRWLWLVLAFCSLRFDALLSVSFPLHLGHGVSCMLLLMLMLEWHLSLFSHAGSEGRAMHRGSRPNGLRRVDFRSGEGMLGDVWVGQCGVRECVRVSVKEA